jgi:sortase A
MRRVLRVLSVVLVVGGALLLADAAATLLWKEPVSSLYARHQQARLGDRLAELSDRAMTPVERKAVARLPSGAPRLAFAARALARHVADGEPLGRIRMPSIGVSSVVVAGTGTADLRKGPGHYPGTPLPGQRGTVAIAGHRTTYGAPFRKLDRLRPGAEIELSLPYGSFRYRVERTRIVLPTATWVTRRVRYDQLVLSACHPVYSAAKRIVVFARLVHSEPRSGVA